MPSFPFISYRISYPLTPRIPFFPSIFYTNKSLKISERIVQMCCVLCRRGGRRRRRVFIGGRGRGRRGGRGGGRRREQLRRRAAAARRRRACARHPRQRRAAPPGKGTPPSSRFSSTQCRIYAFAARTLLQFFRPFRPLLSDILFYPIEIFR